MGRKRRGQIKEQAENVFDLRIQPSKADGNRSGYFERFYGTRQQAEEHLANCLIQLEQLEKHPERFKTVGEMYADWLKVHRHEITEKTLEDYQNVFRRYVLPILGETLMIEVRPAHIKELYFQMQERGLSSQTVRKTHMPLKAAFNYFVQMEWLTTNPCQSVKPPKFKPSRQQNILTLTELQTIFAACRNVSEKALWMIGAFTGARPQEYLAARWKAIDLGKGIWEISEVVSELKGYKFVYKKPKTDRSKRALPLQPTLIEVLQQHRVSQIESFSKAGWHWDEETLLFPSEANTQMSNSNLNERFKRLLAHAGLETKFFLIVCDMVLLLTG